MYSTYLGGGDNDHGQGIVVDAAGRAYVTGLTASPANFPTTAGSYQPVMTGVGIDAVITVLNATGSALVYSTYLGGSGNDVGQGIAVDGAGHVLISGNTASTDFPIAGSAHQIANSGESDLFLAILDITTSTLDYSTYLGSPNLDTNYGLALDRAGHVYLASTNSGGSFPTANALQPTHGGQVDGVVVKIEGVVVPATQPIAAAGVNQSVLLGTTVQLDGIHSYTPTVYNPIYEWTLVSRPAGSAARLANAFGQTPTLTPDMTGNYVAALVVRNDERSSDPDLVTIAVHITPITVAGENRAVLLYKEVQLDGGHSTNPGSAPLSYQWTLVSQPAGSAAALVGASTQTSTFTPDVAGDYVVDLVIGNEEGSGLPDQVTLSAQSELVLQQWGAFNPQGIAIDAAGDVYVVETNLHRVRKFDRDGHERATFGSFGSGDGQLNTPVGIAVDADGNIYIADTGNHRVQQYSRDFSYLAQFGSQGSGDGQFLNPRGVVVDADGNIYIADTGNHRVQKFAADGTYLTQWGELGSGDGQLSSPFDLAIDAAGLIYVLDTNNQRVQRFSSDGNYLTQWGERGSGNGQFQALHGMGVDAFSNVYVVDNVLHRVQAFSADGAYLYQWGSQGSDDSQFNTPVNAAINAAGEVYVSDHNNNRVQKFRLGDFPASRPAAYVGPDHKAVLDIPLQLDGSPSSDPNGDPLNYRWSLVRQPAGSSATLTETATVHPTFVADVQGDYVVELIVDDGALASAPDSLTLAALPALPPLARAGSDQVVLTGTTVQLDGSGTSDPNGDPLFYNWAFASKPPGSEATFSHAATANPTFVADVDGDYVVELIAHDGDLVSDLVEVTITVQQHLQVLQWGSPGDGRGQFNNISKIALDRAGNVYIADWLNNRVQKFDRNGNPVGPTFELHRPVGVAVDAAGNIYVTGSNRVTTFDPSGNIVRAWGREGSEDGQFINPLGVAIDAAGDIYVVDHNNIRVQKFDSNGNYLAQWDSRGSGDGQFNRIVDVAINAAGQVYVADPGNYRVQKFDRDGNYLAQWGSQGSGNGQFETIEGIDIDAAGNVYVGDPLNRRVQKFNSNGGYIAQWGGPSSGAFENPVDVAVDPVTYQVYVTDAIKSSVQKFVQSTTPVTHAGLDQVGIIEGTFTLNGSASNDFQGDPLNYTWSLVSRPSGSGAALSGATTVNPTFVADFKGPYTFKLVVDDGIVKSAPDSVTIAIKPIAQPGPDQQLVAGTTVQLDGSASADIHGSHLAYSWSFVSQPDGSRATFSSFRAVNPTFKAGIEGTYLIELAVDNGLRVSREQVTITALPQALLFKLGSQGRNGNGKFAALERVAVDVDGNIYVTDGIDRLVQKFDKDGVFIRQWGGQGGGNGQFSWPRGIAVDHARNVYVTDVDGNWRVQKFDKDGNYITHWRTGVGDEHSSPQSVKVDAAGNVYVIDPPAGAIKKFDPNGNLLDQWGEGRFSAPSGMAIDNARGRFYVVDSNLRQVLVFNQDGAYLGQWGERGSGDGQFESLGGIAVDAVGNVYVTDHLLHRVQYYTSSGSFIRQWGTEGSGDGQFFTPTDLAINAAGDLYVNDVNNYRIQKFRVGGAQRMIANAGLDQNWVVGTLAGVDGRASLNPNPEPITYKWSLVSKPEGSETALSSTTTATPTFRLDEEGDYVVQLVVNDGVADSAADQVTVTAHPQLQIRQWGTQGDGDGQFDQPTYLAFNRDLYVVDQHNNRVQKFDGGGKFIVSSSYNNSNNNYGTPAGISGVDPDFTWVGARTNGSSGFLKLHFRDLGVADGIFPRDRFGNLSSITGIAVDALDHVYAVDTGNHNVRKYKSLGFGNFDLVSTWGRRGDGPGEFEAPTDIALSPSGDIYVLDEGNYRVQQFTADGIFLRQWGGQGRGDGQFESLTGIGIDPDGNVYVVDNALYRVQQFAFNGVFRRQWGSQGRGSGQFQGPVDVAFSDSDYPYVSDGAGHRIKQFHLGALSKPIPDAGFDRAVATGHVIQLDGSGSFDPNDDPLTYSWRMISRPQYSETEILNPTAVAPTFAADTPGDYVIELVVNDGQQNSLPHRVTHTGERTPFVLQWGSQGDAAGQFLSPTSVAVDTAGHVYVVDQSNHRVQKFDRHGAFLTQWGSNGTGAGQFVNAQRVGVNAAGTRVYVTDGSDRLLIFDGDGAFLRQVGRTGSGNLEFDGLSGVAVDYAGFVYVTDLGNHRVQKLGESGNYISQWGSQGSGNGQFQDPIDVAVNVGSSVYVADRGNFRIQQFGPNGEYHSQQGRQGRAVGEFEALTGIGADLWGGVYATQSGINGAPQIAHKFIRGNAIQWGGIGSGAGQFDRPYDVAVDAAGFVYIADNINHRIQKFAQSYTPVANAGPDTLIPTNTRYQLAGVRSYDPNGDPLTYRWRFISRPAGSIAKLDHGQVSHPAFDANKAGTYVIELVVHDGTTRSVPADSVTIIANLPPVADAGPDQVVLTTATAQLDGSGSSDPDGNSLTYNWVFVRRPNGSAAVLADTAAAKPTFTADKRGTYVVRLVVNDGFADSPADSVTIIANRPPVANAGPYQSQLINSTVQFDGSGSSDPDGDDLTYHWTLVSRPAGSNTQISDESTHDPTILADAFGRYVLQLVVNDGLADSPADSVAVRINQPPVAAAGPYQFVRAGAIVQLDGSGSSDADGDSLSYHWVLESKPAPSTTSLSAGSSATPTFEADEVGTYVLRLTVNDGALSSPVARVTIRTEQMHFLFKWNAAGSFDRPQAKGSVALDGLGNLYVVEHNNSYIQKFDTKGTGLAQWGGSQKAYGNRVLTHPTGVAASASAVFVVDRDNNRVVRFDSGFGNEISYVTEWGIQGSEDGQFRSPMGIAVGPGGVYVVDQFNFRIQRFDGAGDYRGQWGTQGSGDEQFGRPMDVAVDSEGFVYVADMNNNRIQKFDRGGRYIGQWGTRGDGEGQFDAPQLVDVDGLGHVYVADGGNRIQKFSNDGRYIGQWSIPGGVTGMAVTPAGFVYVSDGLNRVQKFAESLRPVPDAHPKHQYAIVREKRVSFGSGLSASPLDLPLTCDWRLIHKPDGSTVTFRRSLACGRSFFPDVEGLYRFELRVSDGTRTSHNTAIAEIEAIQLTQPTADAGPDQLVTFPMVVDRSDLSKSYIDHPVIEFLLDGSASSTNDSEVEELLFKWTLIEPHFPSDFIEQNRLFTTSLYKSPGLVRSKIRLIVTNRYDTHIGPREVKSSPDEVFFTANGQPAAVITSSHKFAPPGTTVQLSGSSSFDFDRIPKPLTYEWRFLNKPLDSAATFSNSTAVNPSFVGDVNGVYEIQLRVYDGLAHSEWIESNVQITLDPVARIAIGNAVAAPEAAEVRVVSSRIDGSGSAVPLNGSESINSFPESGLSYNWTVESRPPNSNAGLGNPMGEDPIFRPNQYGDYQIKLVVSNNFGDETPSRESEPKFLTIRINRPPVADAGPDQTVDCREPVQLDGIRSHDPDNGPNATTYEWTFKQKPPGSRAEFKTSPQVPKGIIDVLNVENSYNIVASILGGGINASNAGNNRILIPPVYYQDLDDETLARLRSLKINIPPAFDVREPSFIPDVPGEYVLELKVDDGIDTHSDTVTIISPDFEDMAQSAGLANDKSGVGVAWGDYDNDNHLDLYVVNEHHDNLLYKNNKNSTFSDIAATVGVQRSADSGKSQSAAWGDYDNDGDLDLYVVNRLLNNQLYRNDDDGQNFVDIAASALVLNEKEKALGLDVAWGDYNNDGLLDLYVVNAFKKNLLYTNNGFIDLVGHHTFTNLADSSSFLDVIGSIQQKKRVEEGFRKELDHAALWGDVDNDGDLDLYVLNDFQTNAMHENIRIVDLPGQVSSYTKSLGIELPVSDQEALDQVRAEGIDVDRYSLFIDYTTETSVSELVDLKSELNLGKILTDFLISILEDWAPDLGFIDVGDLLRRVVDTAINLVLNMDLVIGEASYGGAWGDYDNDGDLDLFVVNETPDIRRYIQEFVDPNINQIIKTVGTPEVRDPILDEVIIPAVSVHSITGDIKVLDIVDKIGAGEVEKLINRVITELKLREFSVNKLYENTSPRSIVDRVQNVSSITDLLQESQELFIFRKRPHTSSLDYGRDAAWGDYDNDGDLDLYVVESGRPNHLYCNINNSFTDLAATYGLNDSGDGHAAAWGDYDNDGDLDLYLVNYNQPNRLFTNTGSSHRWLVVKLVGSTSNKPAIGARVTTKTGSITQRRDIEGGGGSSQASLPVEFGLGTATAVDELKIYWPSGFVQTLNNVATNQILTITEPANASLTRSDPDPDPISLTDASGAPVATLDFALVASDGVVGIAPLTSAPPSPEGYEMGDNPICYDISTTAAFTSVDVCFNYDESTVNENLIKLFHYEGDAWQDITSPGSPDKDNNILCGHATSLSPFGVFQQKNELPVAIAGPEQTVEVASTAGTPVTLDGSRSSDPDGDQLTYTWRQKAVVLAGPSPRATTGVTLPFGTHALELTVDDHKSGPATAQTTVHVVDTTAPTLALLGANPLVIECNVGAYVEPGAKAVDLCDGDLSEQITIDASSVDTSQVGTYTVTYTVSDAAGNAATRRARTIIVQDTTPPVLTLTGANPQILECRVDAYTELGAMAFDNRDGALTPTIDISAVDPSQVGTYTVTYTAADLSGNTTTGERTVQVQDTTPPEITLLGEPELAIEAAADYTDAGATALDLVDGDLSDQIQIDNPVDPDVPGYYTITYTIADAAGNAAEPITRKITVIDTTPPEIALEGDAPMHIELNTPYVEPGATAYDRVDGDLSEQLVLTGAVNPLAEGTYAIAYAVSDQAGNEATAERSVRVVVTANSYSLIATHGMQLKENARVHSGFVGVDDFGAGPFLADRVELSLGPRASTAHSVRVSAPQVRLKDRAQIEGALFYNRLDAHRRARVGEPVEDDRDVWPLFAEFALPAFLRGLPGTVDIDVGKRQILELDAIDGPFGEIRVRPQGILVLTGGEFHIDELDIGNKAAVVVRAPSTLLIKGHFGQDQKAYFGPEHTGLTPADIFVYVEGGNGTISRNDQEDGEDDGDANPLKASPKAAQVGVQAVFTGNLYAPNGTIYLRQQAQASGAFIGKDLLVGVKTEIQHQSGWAIPGVVHQPSILAAAKLAVPGWLANGDVDEIIVDNYPNPFNPSTTIRFYLPAFARVDLSVYNVLGQKVRTLLEEGVPAGLHSAVWDGRNANDHPVAGGLYIYQLETPQTSRTGRMMLLK